MSKLYLSLYALCNFTATTLPSSFIRLNIESCYHGQWASLIAQIVKNLPAIQETQV